MAQAFAHNSSLTFYSIKPEDHGWALTVNLAQASVDSSLSREVGETRWQSADGEKQSEWLARYVAETTTLTIDGHRQELGEPDVHMGSHETQVRFALPDWPESSHQLEVYIPGFSNHPNHHNVVYWSTGRGTVKAVLSERNDYRAVVNTTME
ncbi:hypothetical protein [Saccharospirillum salsuginis]|nr:hypothetical protein [Saccharospirillum salsuginis]